MATIKDKPQTQGNSGDYRLPADGPHSFVKKRVETDKEKSELPPYVIAITKHEKEDEKSASLPGYKYDPQDLRAKAQAFLNSPNISSEQKEVLKEILGPKDDS